MSFDTLLVSDLCGDSGRSNIRPGAEPRETCPKGSLVGWYFPLSKFMENFLSEFAPRGGDVDVYLVDEVVEGFEFLFAAQEFDRLDC